MDIIDTALKQNDTHQTESRALNYIYQIDDNSQLNCMQTTQAKLSDTYDTNYESQNGSLS